jgi:clan AA aspartic protease (TIGR02281 family)
MKKVYLVFLLISIAFFALSDTVIQMEPYGGVYRIPCVVNGAKMKFIFDTGASNVCLSMSMAEYLYDNGYIEDEDIKGVGNTAVADGRIVDHIKLTLKDIQIGDLHIHNVEAIVVDGQNAPLLIGQSAIQKLGRIEINGSILTIYNDDDDNSYDDYVNQLWQKLNAAYNNKNRDQVLECYNILYEMGEIEDDAQLYLYAELLYLSNNNSKAIKVLNQIEDVPALYEEDDFDPYRLFALIYFAEIFDYDNYYMKAIEYMELSNEYANKTDDELAKDKVFIGDCYYYKRLDKSAADTYSVAFGIYAQSFGVDASYLLQDCTNDLKKGQKSYRSDEIDHLVYKIFNSAFYSGDMSAERFLDMMQRLAKANNRYAIQELNKAGIFDY